MMLFRLLPNYNNFIVTNGHPLLRIYVCNGNQLPQLLSVSFVPSIEDLSTNLLID